MHPPAYKKFNCWAGICVCRSMNNVSFSLTDQFFFQKRCVFHTSRSEELLEPPASSICIDITRQVTAKLKDVAHPALNSNFRVEAQGGITSFIVLCCPSAAPLEALYGFGELWMLSPCIDLLPAQIRRKKKARRDTFGRYCGGFRGGVGGSFGFGGTDVTLVFIVIRRDY